MDFKEFLLGNKDMIMDSYRADDEHDMIHELIEEWDNEAEAEASGVAE